MRKTLTFTLLALATGLVMAQQPGPSEAHGDREAMRAEMRAKAEARFAEADTDGDGTLDRIEAQGLGERLAKNFERVDANGDGEISRDELKAMHARAGQHEGKGARRMAYMHGLVKGMDDDGNGAISRAELGDKAPKLAENFDAIDTDGNGEISREELHEYGKARRAERRDATSG